MHLLINSRVIKSQKLLVKIFDSEVKPFGSKVLNQKLESKLATIVVYTKMARGEMARMILKHRLTDVEMLKQFKWEGFYFRPDLSDTNAFMFVQDGF